MSNEQLDTMDRTRQILEKEKMHIPIKLLEKQHEFNIEILNKQQALNLEIHSKQSKLLIYSTIATITATLLGVILGAYLK